MFSNLENIQTFRTSKTRNGAFNSVEMICSYVTGQPEVFKSTSGRIVILTLHLTSLVLMAAYSAFLISSLAVQHHDLPFRDLQGLLYDGSYKLGVWRNSYQFNTFSVWGINYLWPDNLVVFGLGLWKNLEKCENMLYQSCCIQ
jgi:hypothetical protein